MRDGQGGRIEGAWRERRGGGHAGDAHAVGTHAKNATAAWNLPILSTRILGQNNHAKRRDHGISPGFPVHYQDLEH